MSALLNPGTTVEGPTNEPFAQDPAQAGGNHATANLANLNATVHRRIEAIRDHLERNPLNRELDPRLPPPNPAWQDANTHHPSTGSGSGPSSADQYPPRSISLNPHARPGTPFPSHVQDEPGHNSAANERVHETSSDSERSTIPQSSSSGPRPAGGPDRNQEPLTLMQQYFALLLQVEALERAFPAGAVRPAPSLLVMQHQFQILADEWQSNPENVPRPNDRQMVSLSTRLISLYQRVPLPPARTYIVTDPAGRQYRLVGPREGLNAAPGTGPGRAEEALIDQLGGRVHQLEDRVRQVILNYNGGFLRRLWLLVRLWLLSYLVSGAGTWTRLLFITLGTIYTIFDEIRILRRITQLIVEPVQRHLEGLVMDGPRQTEGNRDQPGPDGRNAFLMTVQDYLRRAERSLVLLVASLIPGVGERQIAARIAAEAAARARQEEQGREHVSPPASAPAQSEQPTDAVHEHAD